jgi:hypothetical protein
MLSICVQALSNSIWALAHLKSRGMDVDATRAPNVMRFLNELAGAAARALARHHASCSPPGTLGELRLADAQRYLGLVEREFSCQVGAVQLFPVVFGAWHTRVCVGGMGAREVCDDGSCLRYYEGGVELGVAKIACGDVMSVAPLLMNTAGAVFLCFCGVVVCRRW